MLDNRVDRLPVLKGHQLVGIVTRADLVRAFSRSDEEIEREIREEVLLRSYWIPEGKVEVAVRDGEVTLTGTVESDLSTELLPESIQRVPGVVASSRSCAFARNRTRASASSGSSTGAESELGGAAYPTCGGQAARGTPVDGFEPSAGGVQQPLRPR